MFGIGFMELVIIAGVALIVFGPQKLPTMMQQMGRLFLQLRRISSEVKDTVDQVLQEAQVEIDKEEQKKRDQTAQFTPTSALPAETPHHHPQKQA